MFARSLETPQHAYRYIHRPPLKPGYSAFDFAIALDPADEVRGGMGCDRNVFLSILEDYFDDYDPGFEIVLSD